LLAASFSSKSGIHEEKENTKNSPLFFWFSSFLARFPSDLHISGSFYGSLFYIKCLGFLVVLGRRIKRKWIHSIFPETNACCEYYFLSVDRIFYFGYINSAVNVCDVLT
jgi:hypothetical protein